jgi:hypothetical protein
MGQVFHVASCPWGELSMGRVVHGASCLWGELSMGRDVMGRILMGQVVCGASCLGASGAGTPESHPKIHLPTAANSLRYSKFHLLKTPFNPNPGGWGHI